MGSAQRRRRGRESTGRPVGRAAAQALAVFCLTFAVLPAALARQVLPTESAAGAGVLTRADIDATLGQMDSLGRFFAAFAVRDTNGFAQERWRRLSVNYPGTAEILRGLLAAEKLVIGDLPEGRSSAILDDGRIVIDDSLDSRWRPNLLQAGAVGGAAAQRRDYLLPVLMQALARRLPPQDWPWLADHLRAVGGFAELAQDPLARPLLARFFQAKDAYLWLAMQRIGEGDPAARQALARRQMETFNAIRALATDMAATFGAPPAERLQRDWSDYVALVDGFAVTRGWLLLDPALRRTQLGEAARRDADAVGQAAAEVVAAAPRSAVAAARVEIVRGASTTVAPDVAATPPEKPGVTLETLVARSRDEIADNLGARLPLETLAMRPELAGGAPNAAAFRVFAARIKEAIAAPDPRTVIAAREEELGAARQAVSSLQAQVDALVGALEDRAAESARLEAALAAESTRRAEAERRAADEAAAAQALAAEIAVRAADGPPAVVEPAMPEPAAAQAPEAGSRAGSRTGDLTAMLARIEQRPLYAIAAVAAIILLGGLLWLTGRRRAAAPAPAPVPLLLAASPEVPAGATAGTPRPAAPLRPIIEVPEDAPPEDVQKVPLKPAPLSQPLTSTRPLPKGARLKVNGVTPPTAAARAAMAAGAAQRRATRAVGQGGGAREAMIQEAATQAAALGREADTAAHPIVQALRKGNLPLFELLFGELTDLRSPQLQRIVYGGRGEDLAIVCRAVGVDKLLFGSIFLLTDHMRGGSEDEPEHTAALLQMYDRMPPETAQKVLAKWQRNWSGATRKRGTS